MCCVQLFIEGEGRGPKSSVAIMLDFIQTVWIFDPQIFCLDLSINVWIFLSLENCLTFHAYQTMQPISKPLSVVLAEYGHFVATWSVQVYSCGHLVCAGIILHFPVFTQVCAGICLQRQNPLIMCVLMHELSGWVFKA